MMFSRRHFLGSVPALLAWRGTVRADSDLQIEPRVHSLLGRMTLEEKLGQMSQSTSLATPLSKEIQEQIRQGRWGSFLNAGSPEDRAEAQRIAMKESRLGIPLLFGRDVIHGYRTVFPIPIGQSATWDAELIEEAARIAATEAAAEGIRWTFAPMIDITRDPRWGRVAEGLGEDPYLSSVLGVAMVRGFQGDSLNGAASIAACAKHYVGYGAAEGGRDYNSTWIPEILLRQVYLQPFHAAADAGVASFMTGFNALNGVPATGNAFILREVLRKEWKFEGLVVSDYTAIPEMMQHGYAASPENAAYKAMRAGIDMEMVSTTYFDYLGKLVRNGQVELRSIDEAAGNILGLKFRLGLFDRQAPGAGSAKITPHSRQVALRLATESVVLLKNDHQALPLAATISKIAVIGPLANSPVDQMGTWTMDGRAEEVQTPLAALRAKLGAERVLYAPALNNSRDLSQSGFAEALRQAQAADVVLLFLGEEQILSGEAHSRAFLDLPGAQEALVEKMKQAGKPMAAVIMAGRPLTFHEAAGRLDAILYSFHPGTMGGPAIVDLLFGEASPSGKLTMTFPRTVGQVPVYYDHLNTGRPPGEKDLGIPLGDPVNPVGYVSKYIDVDFTPEYPFGYGLAYTTFEYSNLRVSAPVLRGTGRITIRAEIANTGARAGEEIVQFYIHQVVGTVSQPVRALKGFRRIHLEGGEKQTVSFLLTAKDLAIYNERMQRVTEPGKFQVWIAPDSTRGIQGEFRFE